MSSFTDDTEWILALANAFRSIFVTLTNSFASIPANCKPTCPRNLWNELQNIFIKEICNCFRSYWYLLSNNSVAFAHALVGVKELISPMRLLPFLATECAGGFSSPCYEDITIH